MIASKYIHVIFMMVFEILNGERQLNQLWIDWPKGCYPCSIDENDGQLYEFCLMPSIVGIPSPIGKTCIAGKMNEAAYNKNKRDGDPEWSQNLGWCGKADDNRSIQKCIDWASDANTFLPGFFALLSLTGAFIILI